MSVRGVPPFFYLRPDETVLLKESPGLGYAALIFLVGSLTLGALVAGIAIGLAIAFEMLLPPAWLAGGYSVLVLLVGLVAWRRWATTEYALTDARIYARVGRLITNVHFTTHDKITDIRYHKGPLERLLGIERITFATAGGDVTLMGVKNALAIKETAEVARDDWVQRLLQQAGIEERAATSRREPETRSREEGAPEDVEVEPRPAPTLRRPWTGPRPNYLKSGDEPVWYGKPRLVAAASAVMGLVFPAIFLMFALGPAGGGLGYGIIPLLLALPLGWRVISLKYVEFVVTDRRVYARSGVFGTTVSQLTYDKITDITYRQDVFGRLLGFGGLTVNTAGSNAAPIQMVGLAAPLHVKETIERERARYLREESD